MTRKPASELVDERPDERTSAVLAYLKANPWRTADEVGGGCRIDKADAVRLLAQLEAGRLVEMATGEAAKACGRSARAKLYAVKGTNYGASERQKGE